MILNILIMGEYFGFEFGFQRFDHSSDSRNINFPLIPNIIGFFFMFSIIFLNSFIKINNTLFFLHQGFLLFLQLSLHHMVFIMIFIHFKKKISTPIQMILRQHK